MKRTIVILLPLVAAGCFFMKETPDQSHDLHQGGTIMLDKCGYSVATADGASIPEVGQPVLGDDPPPKFIHLNVGKYQAIVAGIALVLTAVQNPDGITSTSTGKGPAVAIEKLQGRLVGQYRKRRPGRVEEETAVHDDHQTRAGMG